MLDLLMNETPARSWKATPVSGGRSLDRTGISGLGIENLKRLGLIRVLGEPPGSVLVHEEEEKGEPRTSFALTDLGRNFVQACREPGDFRRRLETDPRAG